MIKGVIISALDLIDTPGGMVMHAMKDTSIGFAGFGEAYFSQVHNGSIKAWKRHKEMTLNIVVPIGKIKFVLFDDRDGLKQFQEVIISRSNYSRLTIPPMVWLGFQGLSDDVSTLLNIANIEHNPKEIDRLKIDKIIYDWGKSI